MIRVRGDKDDPFSRGFICPKGANLGELHHDPDRLRTPLVRRDGELVEATWDEAFEAIAAGMGRVFETHGRESLGLMLGNPITHHLAPAFYVAPVVGHVGHAKSTVPRPLTKCPSTSFQAFSGVIRTPSRFRISTGQTIF